MKFMLVVAMALVSAGCSAEYVEYLRQRDAAEAEAWRKMTPCQRCEFNRMACTQGQGYDDSARAIAGLPPAPRRQCPECYAVCASEGG